MARWSCSLTCMNHADSPGVVRDTLPVNTCRNFRVKGERQPQAGPPESPNDEIRCIALTQGPFACLDFRQEASQKDEQHYSQAG